MAPDLAILCAHGAAVDSLGRAGHTRRPRTQRRVRHYWKGLAQSLHPKKEQSPGLRLAQLESDLRGTRAPHCAVREEARDRSRTAHGSLDRLLDFHLGAGRLEFFFELGGLLFRDGLLDGLGGAVHQVLCLFQAKTGDHFADGLDDIELVCAGVR